jgi:small ligand-binding sensory domain FIST
MKAGVAVSQQPDVRQAAVDAAVEACSNAARRDPPDLLWLITVGHNASGTQRALEAACDRLGARHGIACTAAGLCASPGSIELERETGAGVMVFHADPGLAVLSNRTRRPALVQRPMFMLLDPETQAVSAVRSLSQAWDGERVVGGGAVGLRSEPVVLQQGVGSVDFAAVVPSCSVVEAEVTQGCVPLGEPMTISKAEGNLVLELDTRPALMRLMEQLSHQERKEGPRTLGKCMVGLLHRGADPSSFQRGKFSVRSLVGVAPDIGAVALGEAAMEGSVISLVQRDGAHAMRALRAAAVDVKTRLGGSAPVAAVYFSCIGRGSALYGRRQVELDVLANTLGRVPLMGMSSSFEFGPTQSGEPGVHLFSGALMVMAKGN